MGGRRSRRDTLRRHFEDDVLYDFDKITPEPKTLGHFFDGPGRVDPSTVVGALS